MTLSQTGIRRIRHAQVTLVVVLLVYVLVFAWQYMDIRQSCSGMFVYGLDDAYIHLEIARNIVEHGTYGIAAGQVSIASSSVAWPWILSLGFLITDTAELFPLMLNVLLGAALLWLTWRLLVSRDYPPVILFIVCMLQLFLLPVLPLVFTGMEALLHAVLSMILLGVLLDFFRVESRSALTRILVLLFLMTLVRYESLSLAAGIGLVLLVQRRVADGVKVMLAAALPVLLAGLLYVLYGNTFLPHSIVLKMNSWDVNGLGTFTGFLNASQVGVEYWAVFRRTGAMLLILGITVLSLQERRRPLMMLTAAFAVGVLGYAYGVQMQHPANMRYEAYLAAPMIVFIAMLLWENRSHAAGIFSGRTGVLRAVLAAVILFPALSAVIYFGGDFARKAVRPSVNIYEQQQQMSRFVERYYADSTICLNDIGSVAFRTDADIVDLAGLGTPSVAEAYKEGRFTTAFIDSLTRARGARIAMVYDSWFKGRASLPQNWIRAGVWQIRESLICGDDEVSIYALDSASLPPLRNALQDFSDELPDRVIQAGIASP